jgi:hypothetical protein
MLLFSLLACGDVTNAVFATGLTTGAKAAYGEVPDLLATSAEVAGAVNGVTFDILGLVDEVRGLAPSARTHDSRHWGPLPACGGDLDATITRTGASQFDWVFTGTTPAGSADFLAGTHYAGSTVAAGDGTFRWNHAAWGAFCDLDTAGAFTVDYDNRDGVDLLVDIEGLRTDGPDVWDADYAYRFVEDGDFQYRTTFDLADDGSDEPALVTVRTRWMPGTGGRSDATLTGGGLGTRVMAWSQCWGADLTLVYQHDDLGITEDVGDVTACVYSDFAVVDRI